MISECQTTLQLEVEVEVEVVEVEDANFGSTDDCSGGWAGVGGRCGCAGLTRPALSTAFKSGSAGRGGEELRQPGEELMRLRSPGQARSE